MKRIKSIFALLMAFALIFNMCTAMAAPDTSVDQSTATQWRLVDPANIELGRSYLIVSEHGALVNASARISTPGDVTGDTQGGMAAKSVTIVDGKVTSEVTPDMIWQFGLGGNNAAASGGLGEGAGYYIRNAAPGEGGGTDPLRRESSYNAQHAPLNTTNAGVNVNQQSILLHVLDAETKTVGLYIWGGNSAWNFALLGTEDGFTAKSRVASATSAAQLLEQLQESPLWLYEPDVDVGVQHYVMATAGPNGSISPTSLSGHVWVNDGEDVTFTFTPAFGYVVDTVTVNGEAVAVTGNTYTIENVTASDNAIHVTFKFDETAGATDVPFILYDDIFSIGNVTTAAIIDLGEGKAANLADVSADMFTVSTRNTRLNGETLIYEGPRVIARAYVNTEPTPLGYITPGEGSDDLVTETPASGRYIVIEFEFFNANGPLPGAMPSGGLQGTTPAIMNYNINASRELKLADGSTITPSFIQTDVVNPALDKFVPQQIAVEGAQNTFDFLLSIDESWKDLGPLPVFIYNHGGGRGGTRGEYFAPVQTASGAAVLSKIQLQQPGKYNAHIIATQNYQSNQASRDALMAFIRNMADEGMVDLNRIYMSGFSAGSGYTNGFYTNNPEFLAAVVPISGGGTFTQAQLDAKPEILNVAMWPHQNINDGGAGLRTFYSEGGIGVTLPLGNATVLQTNQAFNYPYYGFDWTPHEVEAQLFSNALGQSNATFRYGADQEKYADKNIFDWLFDQSRGDKPVEPVDAVFDLLAVNTINNERIAAVAIDMGREILGSSLDLETFTVHALTKRANNGNIEADADRAISKIYVNAEPKTTGTPADTGRYLIIEMPYWGVEASKTSTDNTAYILTYTVTQLKAFQDADGAINPGDVNYVQGRTINELIDRFEYGKEGTTNYRLFRPDDTSVAQPLIVFLHGGGQGTDNEAHMRFHNNLYFAQPEQQAQYPSYVLMPASGSWNNTAFDNIKIVVDKMIADGLVDPARVYITGSSMGGGGTWNFVQRYPDYFAAAVPICPANGIANVENAKKLADLPIWTFTTRGDFLYNSNMNNHNTYSPYLNNYKFTLFNENYIPASCNPIVGVDWDMSMWPHAEWLMAYNVHTDVTMGGRLIDWMFAQKKNTDTSFDLLAVNSINRERISAVVIDLRKDVLGSSLALDTFTVNALATNPRTGATIAASSGNREISKVYVNTAPVATANPPESGQYLIIELVWWGTDLALTSNDNTTFEVNYTVTQNKAFTANEAEVKPGDLTYTQRLIKNELISQFMRGYIKAPESASATLYNLYAPEATATPTKAYPLVVLLHGGGQGSNGSETPLRFQNNLYFAQPEQQAQYPAYVLIPAAGGWGANELDNLKYLIDKMIADGRVDATRIYVTGSSMGGGGTWSFLNRYPDLFAAAMPICAGGTLSDASVAALRDLPIWGFVTRGDSAGLFNGIINTVNRLKANGAANTYLTIFEENYIPRANNNIPADWNMTAWPHAAWLMAYNVHSEVARGGKVIDWLFAQQKSADTSFDLLALNTLNRERIATVVIDMRKDIVGSSVDLDTFTVNALATDPRSGATIAASSGDRVISKIYVNTAPETTDAPPASGQYLVIELVYWGTDLAIAASDSIAYKLNYSLIQNKAFQTADGAVNPGDLTYKQRMIKNDLISQFARGYVKAPDSATSTRYSLYSPEITRVGSDATKAYPLVVLLHGGGQGSDNETHLRFQNNLYFTYPETQEEFPSYVLMPANATTSAAFDNVKVLIDKMIADGRVDPDRVYITGSSMGGAGTWNFIQRYPDLFAAAVPICAAGGISSVANAMKLADLPIWAFVTRGDSLYNGNLNTYNTYSPYMNNYKFTVFEANYIPAEFNRIVGVDWDMSAWPHAAWLMVYNVHVDEERGRMIEWMFAQSNAAVELDVTITSSIKTIVAGCAANIPAEVVFTGDPVAFKLGLYNPGGKLLSTIDISADGKYVFKLDAAGAVAGTYTIKPVGAVDGATITCVEQPADLWAPVVTVNEDTVTITFAAQVSFNASKKSVKLDGSAISNSKVSAAGNAIAITGVTVSEGQKLVIAGVKYAELFPSYSFTFTVAIP